MTDRDDFLAWVKSSLYEAEFALHNGDPGPRRALWSRNEPVSVLGAWRNAHGQQEPDELFSALGSSFSHCSSYAFDLVSCDVVGDMTVGGSSLRTATERRQDRSTPVQVRSMRSSPSRIHGHVWLLGGSLWSKLPASSRLA